MKIEVNFVKKPKPVWDTLSAEMQLRVLRAIDRSCNDLNREGAQT